MSAAWNIASASFLIFAVAYLGLGSVAYATGGEDELHCPEASTQRLCERRLQEQSAGATVGRMCEEEGTYFALGASLGAGGASQASIRITSCNEVYATGRCHCIVVWRDAAGAVQRMRVPVGSEMGNLMQGLTPTGEQRTVNEIMTNSEYGLVPPDPRSPAEIERNMSIFSDTQRLEDFDYDTRILLTDSFRAEADRLEAEGNALAPTPTARELELGLERYTLQQLEMIAGDSMEDPLRRDAAAGAAELLRQSQENQRLANLLHDSVILEMFPGVPDPPLGPNSLTDQAAWEYHGPLSDVAPNNERQVWWEFPYNPSTSFTANAPTPPPSANTWSWPTWNDVQGWGANIWYGAQNFNCLARKWAGQPQPGDQC